MSGAASAWRPAAPAAKALGGECFAAERSRPRSGTLWIAQSGRILDCDRQIIEMLGYDGQEALKGRHIARVLPDLARIRLFDGRGVNSRLAFRCRCAVPFRGITREGRERAFCVHLNPVSTAAGPGLAVILADVAP